MALWQNARGTAENGLSACSQDDRPFNRNATGEWEEQSGLKNFVAPGGAPLSFL
jgi:hypothetical protein